MAAVSTTSLVPSSFLQLYAHEDASQNEEHRRREQSHRNMYRFHTSTSGRRYRSAPAVPESAERTTRHLYSVLKYADERSATPKNQTADHRARNAANTAPAPPR